jgi:hypothetical protein
MWPPQDATTAKWGDEIVESEPRNYWAAFHDGTAISLADRANLPDCDWRRRTTDDALLQKRDALDARNLKSLSAAHVLAHHHVVSPQHVRLRLGELRAVAIVRPRGQTFLLHAHQPLDLILRRLMAMRTTQICRLLIGLFVKKFALIHKY